MPQQDSQCDNDQQILSASAADRTLSAGPRSLVECVIETGRTHQIRVHMASLGCPVVGDAAYGRPGWDRQLVPPPARQLLHAWKLSLKHPVTRAQLSFEAPPPPDFAPFLDAPAKGLRRPQKA